MKESITEALDRYVTVGIRTGDFLYAVLTNNLRNAVLTADDDNIRDLPEIVRFIYDQLPGKCWGSAEKVEAWRKQRGMAGEPQRSTLAGVNIAFEQEYPSTFSEG